MPTGSDRRSGVPMEQLCIVHIALRSADRVNDRAILKHPARRTLPAAPAYTNTPPLFCPTGFV